VIPADHPYRFLIHDRDTTFYWTPDRHVAHLGVKVLKTPPQSLQANALCERLIGTLRRKCLDGVIPLTEDHLRRLLYEWAVHSLGARDPPAPSFLPASLCAHRYRWPKPYHVVAPPILDGWHDDFRLEPQAA
jgi:hypothetical protein